MVTQLSEADVADMRAEDSGKAPEAKRVIEDTRLDRLENEGRISKGPSGDIDVSSPVERGGSYRFSPADMQIEFEKITARYEPDQLKLLSSWAAKVDLGDGRNLWDWMQKGQL